MSAVRAAKAVSAPVRPGTHAFAGGRDDANTAGRHVLGRLALAAALTAWSLPGVAAGGTDTAHTAWHGWSDAQHRRVLAHGPWPPQRRPDSGNVASGRPAAIALGFLLFFDPRVSADATIACVSCHDPTRAWTDGLQAAQGRSGLDRNSPTITDLAGARWLGWDGAADSLWAFIIHPLTDRRELASDGHRLDALLRSDDLLACLRGSAFDATTRPGDRELALVQTAKALAAYVETLESPRTPFDAYRDALASGDRRVARRYPEPARRGLAIFLGRGNCALCHTGPRFTNEEFHHIGRPHFRPDGSVDPGRHGGVDRVRADRYNRLGTFDDARGSRDAPVRYLRSDHRNWGAFRTPSLRGVALTAPYFHDGRAPDLAAVLDHYSHPDPDRLHGDGEPLIRPLDLSAGEIADLRAFLESLTPPDTSDAPPALPAPALEALQACGAKGG